MTDVETGTELATIERAMGDRHSDYFTGPRIDGETVMARRYRLLIEAGAANTAPIPEQKDTGSLRAAAPHPAPCWANSTGQQILNEWSQLGGIERNHESARIFSAEAFVAVPRETRAELQSQIEGLPDGVQVAMIAELANPYVRAGAATPAQIARFSSTPEGKELLREWGRAAPRRVAAVAERVRRVVGRLSADTAADFAHFADHISSAEYKALANYLSQ